MRNVEELCDDVVMINDGHIVLNGPVNEIKNSFGLTRILSGQTKVLLNYQPCQV